MWPQRGIVSKSYRETEELVLSHIAHSIKHAVTKQTQKVDPIVS